MAGTNEAEADLAAISATGTDGMCGGLVMIAGGLTTLLGVQSLDMLRGPITDVAGALLLALGVPNLVLGWYVRKLRGWAALWASGLATLAALCTLGWAGFLILFGFVSVLACLMVPVNIAAAAAAFVRIKPGKAADAARLRLEEQGLDVGM